jgi:tetratricopeptide (TPR) repeat protein
LQQDLLVSTSDPASAQALGELEALIVPLDRIYPVAERPSRQDLARARQRVAEMEKERGQAEGFAALLAAWSGRLALLEGRKNEALRLLRLSRQGQGGGMEAAVLSLRLEDDPARRLAGIEEALASLNFAASETAESGGRKNRGILEIEKAKTFYDLKRYRDAAAAFDSAFALLGPGVYQDTWRPLRNSAWDMRDIDAESGAAAILSQERFTWRDLALLTQAETDLLRFLTAGRNLQETELLNRLVERGFILPWERVPQAGDTVPRSGAAYFLWRIFAENRADPGLLNRYSSRFRFDGRPFASPVPDVPLDAPFFDAALGVVEREFMDLPDGRNFFPDEPVRGAAFLLMLRKVSGAL